jgi:hypothetical protein
MKDVKDFNLYNYDNNFSVRIKLDNGNILSHLTDNIFSIDLPKILMTSLVDNDELEPFRMSLKSTKDGSVENEVYNTLCKANKFDIEVSLTNPNKIDFTFNECSVSSVGFAQLAHKAKANPFNFFVEIDYKYAKYFNSGEVFAFGDVPIDLSDIKKESEIKGED